MGKNSKTIFLNLITVMSDTLLEQCRLLHSEVEYLRGLINATLKNNTKALKSQLKQDQLIYARLNKITENSKHLKNIYEDELGVRQDEMSELSGRNAFHVFYQKVREIKKKKNDEASYSISVKTEEVDTKIKEKWSGPEWQGRFLDLQEHYQIYINLLQENKRKVCTYRYYVKTFHHFHRIHEKNKHYKNYLNNLLRYLANFWDRRFPLYSSEKIKKHCLKEFERKWKTNSAPGYNVDFSIEHLEKIERDSLEDDDLLKLNKLQNIPDPSLFCRISQKWFNNSKALKSFKCGKKYLKKKNAGIEQYKEIGLMEEQVFTLALLLKDFVKKTVEFIEKQQTKTYEEIKREIEEHEQEQVSDEEEIEEDNPVIYNPLKIPLDFDGKPIPYWLYKFRGLNRYFKCQICGNREYRGPMSFERHFSEWRHAHGMRTLGIPNTKDFMWITNINDAIALWAKIKDRKKDAVWNPADEEVEDAEGNVYNRPTFENLHYQQLINV